MIDSLTFPLYKLRSYIKIEQTPLDLVEVTTIKGKYILDDRSVDAPFYERRLRIKSRFPDKDIYKLKEQVPYLRQLIKYRSGTTFIDSQGNIFKYKKSSKLFEVKSHKIEKVKEHGNWTVFNVSGIETPFMIGEALKYNVKYASIMHTSWGPFLFDLTSKPHEVYRRKL